MHYIHMRFPGGKQKALTLSYDDGVEQDVKLISIMKKHGLKGTFNLNSGRFAPEGTVYPPGTIGRLMTKSAALALYKDSGMEVAVHGVWHCDLEELPDSLCRQEVLEDRLNLERDFGGIVRGMAYPNGGYSDAVVDTLAHCGIAYSRTTICTHNFSLPTDWLRLPTTCHHADPQLMALAEKFVASPTWERAQLFYLWGHSYEFERDNNWDVIEEFAEYIGGRDNIWYATNIEIYDYIAAFRGLHISVDGERVYNPSAIPVYLEVDKVGVCVEPGQTVSLI